MKDGMDSSLLRQSQSICLRTHHIDDFEGACELVRKFFLESRILEVFGREHDLIAESIRPRLGLFVVTSGLRPLRAL